MPCDLSGRIKSLSSGILRFALALAFFACATVSVRRSYDEKFDFTRYRIFSWMAAQDKVKPPPEWVDKLVRAAVEQELLAKGYQKADGKKPDFFVAYQAAVEEKTVWQPIFSGPGSTSFNVCRYTYLQGTLLIEFLDSRSNQSTWSGCAVDVVSGRDRARQKIPAAVKQILEEFPPKR